MVWLTWVPPLAVLDEEQHVRDGVEQGFDVGGLDSHAASIPEPAFARTFTFAGPGFNGLGSSVVVPFDDPEPPSMAASKPTGKRNHPARKPPTGQWR